MKQVGVKYFHFADTGGDGYQVDFARNWSAGFSDRRHPSESYWIVPGTCEGDGPVTPSNGGAQARSEALTVPRHGREGDES